MDCIYQGIFPEAFFAPTVDYIRQVQLPSGAIPWFEDGYCDPWDHVESAMGLSIGGDFSNAERAYFWLAEKQLDDGSWWAAYKMTLLKTVKDARLISSLISQPAFGTTI